MEVHAHARPHIETHTRSQGHSAIAGVAYRQGLKLLDERTGIWHDYHRRSVRGEIILALTIAPEGSPDWAVNPQELWRRVEESEKRKDAQLARDYRIPVPFGMSSDQASALAQQMARFISETLMTPVSVAVHRDSNVDVLGEKKAAEKVGYHAHLYFPTRRLACFEEMGKGKSTTVSINTDSSAETTGFGGKLTILSNKRTSAEFVEHLNAKWAELCNEFADDAGLRADYDHRSYARQGIDITPQPTVGQGATALERKGIVTHRGNVLRKAFERVQKQSEPVVEPTELTPAMASSLPLTEPDFAAFNPDSNVILWEKLSERRQQLGLPVKAMPPVLMKPVQTGQIIPFPFPIGQTHTPLIAVPIERPSDRQWHVSGRPRHVDNMEDKPSLSVLARRHHLSVAKTDSIVEKLEKNIPPPLAASEKQRFKQSLELVKSLERLLGTLEAALEDEEKKLKFFERVRASALDADFQIDQARRGRKIALNRLKMWQKNRPKVRLRLGLAAPAQRRGKKLEEEYKWKDDLVQASKRAAKSLHAFSRAAKSALERVQTLIVGLRRDLAVAAVDLRSRDLRIFQEFSKWLSLRLRKLLEESLPGPTDSGLEVDEQVDAGTETGAGGNSKQKGISSANKPAAKPEVKSQMKW